MKKLTLLFLIAAALMACDPQREPVIDEQGNQDFYEAYGTVHVATDDFIKENVRLLATVNKEGTTLDVKMFQVKFAEKMPVTIDMVIPKTEMTRLNDIVFFTADSINPMMGVFPVEKYMVTKLNGYIASDSIIITNYFGPHYTEYRGKRTK